MRVCATVHGRRAVVAKRTLTLTPVTLDCLSRTASVAGVDASRLLSARGFPSVPAGGEVTLALTGTGTGTVAVEWRDTYI